MWTSTQSGVRRALTVFALLLTMTLVVAAILVVVQRAFPAQTHTYQSYDIEVTPSGPWHPGQSLSLLWVPGEARTGPDEPPRSVTCSFSLYGPYATQAAAQAGKREPTSGGGAALVASAPSLALSTDLAAPAPTPVAYALPEALAPGCYVVVASADVGDVGGGASTAWVVEVAA